MFTFTQEWKVFAEAFIVAVVIVLIFFITKYANNKITNRIIINNRELGAHLELGTQTSSAIPNKIWSYWDGDLNPVVQKCIDSWHHYNPTYEIIILNKKNLSQYCPSDVNSITYARDSEARYSDYVRLNTLAYHGGIWIDASCICHQSFDWIHGIQRKTGCEFVGYYLDKFTNYIHTSTSPVIESWFFACTPRSRFVEDWRNEFMRMSVFDSINSYIDSVIQQSTDLQRIDGYNYLAIHVAAQHILQKFKLMFSTQYSLYLLLAEKAPYSYLNEHEWNVANSVEALKNISTSATYYKAPFIKLRGSERGYLTQNQKDIDVAFSHLAPSPSGI